MHYYQHHIGDYRRDTIHLTLLEHGVYRQLMDCYYLSESPLPTETEAVCRRISARTEEEREAVRNVLNEFFKPTPEGWIHTRCDKEIASYQTKARASRANGKLGGRPVSGNKDRPGKGKTQPVKSGFPEETQPKGNSLTHKPINPIIKQQGSAERDPTIEGCRLPEDWTLPDDWRQWAAAPPRSLSMEKIDDEAAWFKSYWLKCEDLRAFKKDWRATWRNWIEKNLPKKGQGQAPEKFNALAYVNGWHKEGENGNVIEHS